MTRADRLAASRRSFMKSVGKAATALPFYRLVESSAVFAAGDQPLRFVGFYAPHGVAAPIYNKQPGDTETAFNLNFADSVLSPLDDVATYGKSFKDKVIIIEGMDMAAGVDKNINGHDASCIMLTGSAPMGQNVPNESIDQYLAVTKGLGKTRISSMVLGVGYKGTESGRNLSYSKAGAPISKVIDPLETWKQTFETLIVGNDPGAKAEGDKIRARGQSVLDYIKDDIKRMDARLAGPEKLKLEQHLAAIRDLEKSLGGGASGGSAPTTGCAKPIRPDAKDFPKTEVYNGGQPYLEKICDLQIEMIAQAMACDVTRFATLFYFLTEDIHNSVAHPYQASNRASVLNLGKQNRYYIGKLAKLMKRLSDFGILDSTIIYMSSDMGDPAAHSLRAVPTIIAGGANGKFKMGRRLAIKKSNNKILVSVANAFGVDVNTYGQPGKPEITDGALGELG